MSLKPVLPQHDPMPEQRKQDLVERRAALGWDQEYLPPLAMVSVDGPNKFGPSPEQALRWAEVGVYTTPGKRPGEYRAERLVALQNAALNEFAIEAAAKAPAPPCFDDYAKMFKTLPFPKVVETWSTDFEFAYQRLGGMNPLSIRRVDAVPENFAITNERLHGSSGDSYSGVLRPGVTLEGEAAAGRLFLCDYSILEGLPSGSDTQTTTDSGVIPLTYVRSVMPVLGLFHIDAGDPRGPRLAPLAVQLGLEPRESAVFTPNDGKAWLVAKICFQCADASYHEMGLHLLGTHFIEEAFEVAFTRTMAKNHPLYKLMSPHFELLEANNFVGREILVSKGGRVDMLMGGSLATSLKILERTYEGYPARGVKPWTFEEWDLPHTIDARGVDNIPDYPYRDDGMLVWDAIHQFVTAYAGIYYGSDADVHQDHELQAWMADLTAKDGGHVRGVPSSIESVAQLVTVLTRIIYACGPLHSAINFSQYDSAAFAPNMPLALYVTPAPDVRALDDTQVSALITFLLPPPAKAALQIATIAGLVSVRTGQLGQYEEGAFNDPAALFAIGVFQQNLAAVEKTINARNLDRQFRGLPTYQYLLPSQIVPSSSV